MDGVAHASHASCGTLIQQKNNKNSLNAGFISHVIQECDGLVPHPGQVARDDSPRVARGIGRDPPARKHGRFATKNNEPIYAIRGRPVGKERTLVVVRLIPPATRVLDAHGTGCYRCCRCRCRSCDDQKMERGPLYLHRDSSAANRSSVVQQHGKADKLIRPRTQHYSIAQQASIRPFGDIVLRLRRFSRKCCPPHPSLSSVKLAETRREMGRNGETRLPQSPG